MRHRHYGSTVLLPSLQEDWVQAVSFELFALYIGYLRPHRTDSMINLLIIYAINRGTLTA